MAKQRGIIQPVGKLGDFSFYRSRYVDGIIIRQLPANRSEQVKTAEGYANTRAYAADFGRAAGMASALVRGMVNRWRYVINPHRTSYLTKYILSLIELDTTHEIGKRILNVDGWREKVADKFVSLSKNRFDVCGDVYGDATVEYDGTEGGFNVTGGYVVQMYPNGFLSIDEVDGVLLYNNFVYYHMADPNSQGELDESTAIFRPLHNLQGEYFEVIPKSSFGSSLVKSQAPTFIPVASFPYQTGLVGQCLVCLPYQQIGTRKYILQKYCSFYWMRAEVE